MIDKQRINALLASGDTMCALEMIAGIDDDSTAADRAYAAYIRGRAAWKAGRRTEAMSLYAEAAQLDATSEGAVALEQAQDIMQFFNRDLYNP